MLGDDIMDGTKKGVSIIAHAAKNVLKGALLFAAVVGGGYALGIIGMELVGAGVSGFGAGLVEAFTGSASAAAAKGIALSAAESAAVSTATTLSNGMFNAAGFGSIAAIAGGIATGAASLLPGKDQGFTLRRGYRKLEEMGRGRDRVVEPETVRDTSYSAPAPAYLPAPQPQPIIVQSPEQIPAPQQAPIIVHAQQPQQQPPIVIVQQPAPQAQAPLQLDVQQTAAPLPQDTQPQEMAATATGDNPYFRPGKGVELMQRGNATQTTLSK